MIHLSRSLRETIFLTAKGGLLVICILALSSPAMAKGAKCPVWTSAMIDGLAVGGGLFLSGRGANPPHAIGETVDDPRIPMMSCVLRNDFGDEDVTFSLRLGDIYPNQAPNEGFVGTHKESGMGDNYIHLKWPEDDFGAAHACRAEVLQSFVWKRFCEPALP